MKYIMLHTQKQILRPFMSEDVIGAMDVPACQNTIHQIYTSELTTDQVNGGNMK